MNHKLAIMSLSSLMLMACEPSTPMEDQAQKTHNNTSQAHTVQNADQVTPSSLNQNAPLPTGDTAETSLDWHGEYQGVFPCADCEGIKTELELNLDKTYELSEEYLGQGKGHETTVKGKFVFDRTNPSIIILDQAADGRRFFVGENQIFTLDRTSGKKIEGPLAQHYILIKEIPSP